MPGYRTCQVCSSIPRSDLLDLNALLADPDQWPKSLLADWIIPKGALPSSIRLYGGVATGMEWCKVNGFPGITKPMMGGHFNAHVVHIAKDPQDTEQLGKMGSLTVQGQAKHVAVMPQPRPNLFVDYYTTGIQLGVYALERLRSDILELEALGTPIPHKTLWQMAELGAKLSMSQAMALGRGNKIEETSDEMAGFRAGEAPLPSQRFGDHRIRTIEGESRPVVDTGKADRDRYNKRAKQEGSPTFDA